MASVTARLPTTTEIPLAVKMAACSGMDELLGTAYNEWR
jgi:hypothetical protein